MFSLDDDLKVVFLEINLIMERILENFEIVSRSYFISIVLIFFFNASSLFKDNRNTRRIGSILKLCLPLFLGRANSALLVNRYSKNRIIATEQINLVSVGLSTLFSHIDYRIFAIVGSLIIFLESMNSQKFTLHLIFLIMTIILVLFNLSLKKNISTSQNQYSIWESKSSQIFKSIIINIFILSIFMAIIQTLERFFIIDISTTTALILLLLINIIPIFNIISPLLVGLNLLLLNNIYVNAATQNFSIFTIILFTYFVAINSNNSNIMIDFGIARIDKKANLRLFLRIIILKTLNNSILFAIIVLSLLFNYFLIR